MTLFDRIKKARELGFDGIRFSDLLVLDGEKLLGYARKLGDACRGGGLSVALYAYRANLLAGCDGDLEKEVERLKQQILVTQLLGAPIMCHDLAWEFPQNYTGIRLFDSVLPRLVGGTRELIGFANSKGIKTCTKNHGHFCQDSGRMLKIVSQVGDSHFGLLVDMENFIYVDETSNKVLGKLVANAFHVHAKDIIFEVD